ncbi:MAG: protoporphyrinogen oxidase [Betaproteobacteria bacterium]|nr:protoporphyrinogen oxidase [Betaproteobacteria bacterium]
MEKFDVLIIGGGITGLASAWWLARGGLSVAVWEAGERPGGKIQSTRQQGYLTERAASMVLNFRPEVSELMHEAGLEAAKTRRRAEAEAQRYLLHGQGLKALPMKLGGMIGSPLWSLRGKLRLLAEPFIFSSGRPGESVSEFITRRLGREVLDKAVEPFVAGTLAADPDQTCAAAALPRLTALEQRYGSLAAGVLVNRVLRRRTACSTEVFSFQNGMGTLVDRLAAGPGVRLCTGHAVTELRAQGEGWRVRANTPQGERSAYARQLILATPAPAAAKLLAELDPELSTMLQQIRYASVALVHLGFSRQAVAHPLNGTGFLAPKAESPVLTGNLWASTLFPERAPPGKVLLTSYLGGARAPFAADWDDARLVEETLQTLRPLLGLKADPDMVRVDRQREALPLYHGAYQRRMQSIAARLKEIPGLHLEASYREGVSVRDRLLRGHVVAKHILASQPWPESAPGRPASCAGAAEMMVG